MIKVYAKEYLNICDYLVKNSEVKQRRKKIIVPRELLERLLHKNNYQETAEKIRIWRKLGWIEADEGHLTKRVYMYEEGAYKRMYVLKKEVYLVLKDIIEIT